MATQLYARSPVHWQLNAYSNGNQSGAVTITPANGARQASTITGNITGLTCALSTSYPYVIWEITTDGAHSLDLTGWETDNGTAITLPDTGKAVLVLQLSTDGTTKYAFLAATEVA
jgi:hypothetical protein